MTSEHGLTAKTYNEQSVKAAATPEGLSRSGRRAWKVAQRRAPTLITIENVSPLDPLSEVLERDDISTCRDELVRYACSKNGTELGLERYRICRLVDIPEAVIRENFARTINTNVRTGETDYLWRHANLRQYQRFLWMIDKHYKACTKYLNDNRSNLVEDEDSVELARVLVDMPGVSVGEILTEVLRTETENIELIKMQIEWLGSKLLSEESAGQKISQPGQLDVEVPDFFDRTKSEKLQIAEETFPLSGWEVFWTETPWSINQNHLVAVPTSSQDTAIRSVADISRGVISIKPASVVRALEFHLGKNVLQRALAARNKYGPEGIRDWVKIKRGRDRIFMSVSEEGRKVIFFASGRDIVYRGI